MKSIARLSWLTIFLMLTACIPASSYRGTPVSQTMQSAEIPGNELCDLEMLTPSVQWQRELDDIRLILTIYNYSELRCQLVGKPNAWVEDSSGFLFSQNQESLDTPEDSQVSLWLEANGSVGAKVDMVWENWCGPYPKDGLRLVVLVPENPGKIDALIQDPGGQPLLETPACLDQEKKSNLTISVFQAISP